MRVAGGVQRLPLSTVTVPQSVRVRRLTASAATVGMIVAGTLAGSSGVSAGTTVPAGAPAELANGAVSLAAPEASWPLGGPRRVVRPFAPGPTRYSAGHYGADLAGYPGQSVRAARAGRVSFAGRVAGRGVVVVDHGSLRTTYEPVAPTVRVGAAVAAGARVGILAVGHGGCGLTRVCLHWGLRRGEDYLDPIRLVRRAPVILLPSGVARAG